MKFMISDLSKQTNQQNAHAHVQCRHIVLGTLRLAPIKFRNIRAVAKSGIIQK